MRLFPRAVCGVGLLALAACSGTPEQPEAPTLSPTQARALIERLLPSGIADRGGWAVDIYAGFAAMELAATPSNICSVIAVTEQESGFQIDPPVPGLAAIAWKEIDSRAAALSLPKVVVRTGLKVNSPDGRSYAARIDAAKTERALSEIFDDLIGALPLGRTFFADRNPVRTGGPMQVSIAYAEQQAERRPYPYVLDRSLRREVFTRRGGMYFGIAHLLDYPASYPQPIFRFADFNAGHYASRNAAFQSALSLLSGVPLVLDGDLLRFGGEDDKPSQTELAARVLAKRLGMSHGDIRDDLQRGDAEKFERTRLYEQVFERAEQAEGRPLPRALLPQIQLKSPKISRNLTTEWFAKRVDERYRRCLLRAP
ncbi:DUF1615 domain-containing protein [Nevskia sp.]|uniref:DUF1615 domain-containing protein n=1 Tax=Nevskia sp. TaxID=1929292 RepID=UPI0025EBC254|nr:DUF1615 domain-containing protein [Nevskia sp.]